MSEQRVDASDKGFCLSTAYVCHAVPLFNHFKEMLHGGLATIYPSGHDGCSCKHDTLTGFLQIHLLRVQRKTQFAVEPFSHVVQHIKQLLFVSAYRDKIVNITSVTTFVAQASDDPLVEA